jgi:hypothetical protein
MMTWYSRTETLRFGVGAAITREPVGVEIASRATASRASLLLHYEQ